MRRALAAGFFSALLCLGCGGGGGGGDAPSGQGAPAPVVYAGSTEPAELSPANAKVLVYDVLGSDSDRSPPAGRPSAGSYLRASQKEARFSRWAELARTERPALRAAASRSEEVIPCESGRIRSVSELDENGVGWMDFAFQACRQGAETIDGIARIDYRAWDFATGEPTSYTIQLVAVRLQGTGTDETASGSLEVEVNPTSGAERLRINMTSRDNLLGRTIRAEDLVLVNAYGSYGSSGSYTSTMNGRVYDASEGYVEVLTLEALHYASESQDLPDAGRLVLTGARGAQILVECVSAEEVSLGLDLDANGTWEWSARLPWAALLTEPEGNTAPTVAFSHAKRVITPGAVSLDASGSTDAEHDFVSFRWELTECPEGSLASLEVVEPSRASLQADLPGRYAVRVAVSDGAAESSATARISAVPAVSSITPDHLDVGTDDVLYLLDADGGRVERWSLTANARIDPLSLQGSPTLMAYSPVGGSLYFGYATGSITRLSLEGSPAEETLAGTVEPLTGLVAVGNYLLAADPSGAWATHYVFSLDGRFVTSRDWNHYSQEYAWSQANSRVYFFRDGTSPNDLHYEEIGPDGQFTGEGETPYHGGYVIKPPIRVAPDGSRVLLGSGDIYDGQTLEILESLPVEPSDAVWLDDGLLTLRAASDGRTLLEHWGPDSRLFNFQYFDGTPLRVFRWSGGYAVLTLVGGRPVLDSYTPTDDADGDGVQNSVDVFPLDAAASADTDGDGWPDAWNPGYGQADSSSGLHLDAFPEDSACQLAEHALSGDPSLCDIARAIPYYSPKQLEIGAGGVVYLLAGTKIFRWSLADARHLNPIVLTDAPLFMTYAADLERLYLAYDTGSIKRIDLTKGVAETVFATVPGTPTGLAAAGQYVLAVDPSGAWATHYTFGPEGAQISAVDWNYRSDEYVWSPVNRRVYFLRDDTSPNDIHYEVIDDSGNIAGEGESPYHGDYRVAHPIRVSADGSRVLLGSGDVYDGLTLVRTGGLPIQPTDALWTASGELLTIRPSPDGRCLLERWDALLNLTDWKYFTGSPLRLVTWSGMYSVVTLKDGRPAFQPYGL